INCAVRSVGTFPPQPPPPAMGQPATDNRLGVVPAGAPPVTEVRRILNDDKSAYVDKLALGGTGFNIPSLLGLAASAPYFHAGNARSLEELFDPTFAAHASVFGEAPPTPDEIRALVSYLLSIDDSGSPSAPLEPPS